MTSDTASAQGQELAVRFVGSGSEYFRIWIVNLLLTMLTLGLYYPFAKVRRLRYFYGATEVGGQPLAFHADPWKMLRGYLLVAVLLGVYSVAGRFSPVAGLVAFVIVALLWPALWHSSLRFRMANTDWRGLRLRFVGQRSGAYRALIPGFAMGFVMLVFSLWMAPPPGADPASAAAQAEPEMSAWLAFGFLGLMLVMMASTPALLWLMRRYQHSHYALAGEVTRFSVPLRAFYGLAVRTSGVSLLAALVGGAILAGIAVIVKTSDWTPGMDNKAMMAGLGVAAIFFVILISQLLAWPYFTARQQNLVWNGTRSDQLLFQSHLKVRSLMGLSLKNWLLMLVTLGLYYPFATIATARLRLQAVQVTALTSPDELLARTGPDDEAAAGDAAGDLLGLDVGL